MAKKRIFRTAAVLVLIAAVVTLTRHFWLPLPASFLLIQDNVRRSDCIVVLGGDDYFRIKEAARLLSDGYARHIIFSPVPERAEEVRELYNFDYRIRGLDDLSPREYARKAFAYFGVPADALLLSDAESLSTYDEALAARAIMREKGFTSLIVVTSTYHARRSLAIFRRVFRGTGVTLSIVTATNERYDPAHWWRKERDVKAVALEYLSLAHNLFYHHLLGRTRTAFDT